MLTEHAIAICILLAAHATIVPRTIMDLIVRPVLPPCLPVFFTYGLIPQTDCSDSITCSGNGTCDVTGQCECADFFDGPACDHCAQNYFGIACQKCKFKIAARYLLIVINYDFLDCLDSSTCSGNGACNSINGTCDCAGHYAGGDCSSCAENYYGPGCLQCISHSPFASLSF